MKSLRIVLIAAVMMIPWAGQAMAQTVYLNNATPDLTVERIGTPIMVETETDSDWTKEDTLWQMLFTSLEIIDWNQSINSLDMEEMNPFLPDYPTKEQFNYYFIACIAGNAVIAYILPKKYRRAWQIASIGLEVYCVNNNYLLGIRTKF